MNNSRQVVVKALSDMEKRDAWSNIILDNALKNSSLSIQDKSFATAMFYGTLTRRYTIDRCISAFSKTPLRKMDTTVRNILRIGFYQLLYMDSVPDHAAVDESVNLAKTMRKSSASGFINAILRAFIRADKQIPKPKSKKKKDILALQYSCPPELVQLLLSGYGEQDTVEFLESSLKSPDIFLRVNTQKITPDNLIEILSKQEIIAEKISEVPSALRLQGSGRVQGLEEYEQGLFHVQDISSQRVALSMEAKKNSRILDCCAAPGGKTFVISQEMQNTGEIIACDLHQHRVNELNRRKKQLGATNITAKKLDMTEYHEELGKFDGVICDVPCSGYGIIRRSPEIKYQLPTEFKQLPELQYKLLSTASKYCKTGGLLVYSTCTLSRLENWQVVEKFLENNPEFKVKDSRYPQGRTIMMGELGGDGFFYTVLKRD